MLVLQLRPNRLHYAQVLLCVCQYVIDMVIKKIINALIQR